MKTHKLAAVNDDYADDYDPIPQRGLDLSAAYLKASLYYSEYLSTYKKNKKPSAKINNICTLATQGNTYAITLIEKILKKEPDVFARIKNLKSIKSMGHFDQYIPFDADVFSFWGIIDPTRLYFILESKGVLAESTREFKISLQAFKKRIEKNPDNKIIVIKNIIECYPQESFYLQLAFENGFTFPCTTLFKGMWQKAFQRTTEGKSLNLNDLNKSEKEDMSFACYYASKIKPTDNFEKTTLCNMLKTQEEFYIHETNGHSRLRKFYEIWAEPSDNVYYQFDYARMMRLGEGGPVDFENALKFYKMSAEKGYEELNSKSKCNIDQPLNLYRNDLINVK